MRLVAGDIVRAQPVQLAGGILQREHQALPQRILGNAVLALRFAGGALVDRAFPVADFMHGPHDAQGAQASFGHMVQKNHVGRKVPHMGRRIVAETVAPCQMDAYVGAAQLSENIRVAAEDRHIAKLGALIQSLESKIRRDDTVPAIQCVFHHMAANIPRRASDQNRFHGISSLLLHICLLLA